ncbi:MAG TPA: diguanylate cyclase [Armatimonadota bacterium]|nr:diguanylate cyclase [Armatimonadota bacterium]
MAERESHSQGMGAERSSPGMPPEKSIPGSAPPVDNSGSFQASAGLGRSGASDDALDEGLASTPGGGAYLLLVLHDTPENRERSARKLDSAGFRCLVAESGEHALRVAREKKPELALIDAALPDGDGYAFYQRMLEDPAIGDVPVIYLITSEDPNERVRGLQRGGADYLTRPFSGVELAARAVTALRARRERDSLRERARRLEEQSVRDALTGLYNRRLMDERLSEELARADRYGLVVSYLMIDIDFFKQVNDTLGHSAGDDALQQVAALISRCARSSDVVARYGGEEFALILPQTSLREAYEVAERVRRRVGENPIRLAIGERAVTVSVGVASFPGPGIHDSTSLINQADLALLRAKAAGRNRVYVAENETVEGDITVPTGPRILIVEDEPNNQALLQKVLSRMGYEWICVSDGREAVSQVASQRFALVLMDLSLPGMDGWQATRLIRASGNDIPIVVTTAHAMAADRGRASDAGCDSYLTKPFNLTELRRIIENFAPLPGARAPGSAS